MQISSIEDWILSLSTSEALTTETLKIIRIIDNIQNLLNLFIISPNNLNVNLSADILSAGWYKGKNFWSFNIGVRNEIGASIPKSMFEF